jgi:hypothetical protein
MAEPVATTPTPAEGTIGTTPSVETSVDISKYIEPSGKFKEGFKELIPEDLRTNKVYDIPSDIQGVLKMIGHQSQTIGKYGTTKGILPINDKSSPQEIEAYRTALGVPKDSSGYKYVNPQGVTDTEFPPELKKTVFEAFNKGDYTQKQVDVAMGLWDGRMKEMQTQYDTQMKAKVEEAETRIRDKWGTNYDARLTLSKACVEDMKANMTPDDYDTLFGKEVTNPDGSKMRQGGLNSPELSPIRPILLDLFASMKEKYGLQDSALVSESENKGVGSVREQIAELEATPGFMDGKLKQSLAPGDREKHAEIMAKRDILYSKL